ncbi:hypothetical protein Trydic_g4268 [Trypoxylus dichotomus]
MLIEVYLFKREPGSMNSLSICIYAGIVFAQMATYHWVGNEILIKSEKIIESSYVSKWYQLDVKAQKILLLLMERAKRPLIVKLYFIVSLTAYILIGSFLPLLVDISLSIPAPFDTGKYDIIYKVAHFFATGYLAFNTLGLDMLFLTLLSICVAQLNILQERLSKVLEDARKECKSNTKLTLEVHSILRDIVILHETINRFALKISVLLSFPLFIQYTCGCFILCNTVLQLTVLREPGSMTSLSMGVHAGVTFAQMAGYHWIGNEVIFKSEKIIESSYISKWYQLDLKEQKILLLLMERAKRPLIVKVYKFIFISLDSLGVIVRWAYSVFALIKVRYG